MCAQTYPILDERTLQPSIVQMKIPVVAWRAMWARNAPGPRHCFWQMWHV